MKVSKEKDLLFQNRPYVSSADVSIILSRSYVEMRRTGRNHSEKQAENADFGRIPGDALLDSFKIIAKEISNCILTTSHLKSSRPRSRTPLSVGLRL
jgi:hypothetical protein